MNQEPTPPSAESASVRPLTLLSPDELCDMPEDTTPWLVDKLLPAIGTSIVGAPAKTGKSTMARQLCAFVSQGRPFLGREVCQGKTCYISTQEPPGRIAEHFRALGCGRDTMPLVYAGGRIDPRGALDRVSAALAQHSDLKLVVLDMVADLLPLKDANDYVEMNKVFGALRHLAEKHRLHVSVTHHVKKAQTENAACAFIGSSAITGSVDQLIRLHVGARGQRSIDTLQRYGEQIEHTLLTWNAEEKALYLGQGMEEVRAEQKETTVYRIIKEIFDWVLKYPGRTRDEILAAVTGNTGTKRDAFNRIFAEGHLSRSGTGDKGDPYTYTLAEKPSNTAAVAA